MSCEMHSSHASSNYTSSPHILIKTPVICQEEKIYILQTLFYLIPCRFKSMSYGNSEAEKIFAFLDF